MLLPPPAPVSVLLVDDQPRNVVALEAALARVDCSLVKANSGGEALKLLLTQDFAVILLDIRMPDIDGFETARLIRLRDRSRATPIIFMTAHDPAGARNLRGYQLGAVDYMFKPFEPDVLRSKVTVFVELFRTSLALEQQAAKLTTMASELESSKEHFRALIEDASELTLIIGANAIIRYASPSVERILGYLPERLSGRGMAEFLHPDDMATLHWDIARLLKTGAATPLTPRRWRHVNGSDRVLESTASNLLKIPSVAGVVVHARDVTERNTAQEQVRALNAELDGMRVQADLRHQSLHDGLTGLPNRVMLNERLERAIRSSGPDAAQCALLLLDLDRFKEVNDTLGHQVGDDLLRQIGERLQSAVPSADLVARLGGDEFAVLLPNADAALAARAAGDLMGVFRTPFMLDGQSIEVDASIGIATAPQHGQDADTLFRRADVAMYQAKRSGVGVAVYSRAEDEHRPDRLALLGELRHAIEADELLLYYQPKLDLRDGTLVGLEALVRWRHPQRGFLAPSEFIPLAEQSELIHLLSLWVIEAALRQQQAWRAAGLNTPVAVNVSRRVLQDLQLPNAVAELLTRWRVPASALVLEITESSLMADPVRAHENLEQLRSLGVRLSIDDFGTGYSSLASLQDLSVDELKIDRSFVQAMASDGSARAIVRAIIDLGDALKLQVVAEGVEDRTTWDLLAGLGCEIAQGYFLSPPLAATELEAWVGQVGPSWVEIAASRGPGDPLWEHIHGRATRLTAEEEFVHRNRAEAALRVSEERNRLALQAARMGTWNWDVIHDVITWSAETEALHGLARGTFDGTTAALRRSIVPEDLSAFETELKASIVEHREALAAFRTIWPDGSLHWIETRSRALYSADGAVERVNGTSVDITDRRLAEEALRASEERFRRQYKSFPLPTFSWVQEGDDFLLQDFNDVAVAVVPTILDGVGTTLSELFGNRPEILADLNACVAEQKTLRREMHYRYHRTGLERDLVVTYVFVPPRTVMTHVEDVTDARQAEKQRETMAQSEKLRALGQVASGIAHDLNQSLMLVSSYSDLARQALALAQPDVAEAQDLLTTATQAALDGGETVKRLLLFARAAPESVFQLVDLNKLVCDAAQLTAPRWRDAAQAEGRPISLHVEAEDHPIIKGSAARLRELLTTLIFNAVDALPTGGEIRLRVLAESGQASIEVVDSGLGMSAEVQARVFEPFFTTKGESGTGLGLAMAFGIVEQHGGHIEAHSVVGNGTSFHITFPLVNGLAADEEPSEVVSDQLQPRLALRILVVDDEPVMTKAMVRMLKPSGHLVSVAGSGEEALEN